jgi:hypothetical protein
VPVVTADPDVGLEPPQEPCAVHAVLLVVLQVRFALVPADIDVGFTEICTVGRGGAVVLPTIKITSFVTLPPVPLHVRE